ncbi:MAG: PLP-dependent lyase/thiolase, partial [Sulfitobacter sp.]|nr:PLP-dependent lyase/thiolase [Sulfitobacter sp.]
QAGAGMAQVGGLHSTPSGAAGLSALLALDADQRTRIGLSSHSTVLCILSEGPEA